MSKKVLVIAAHADDEALGCGGAIARHSALGDQVHVIFIADGVSARLVKSVVDVSLRQQACEQANKILGVSSIEFLNYPDNRLDGIHLLDIVQSLERLIKKIAPEVVYTHHIGDLNIDHQLTHRAVITACRPLPGCSIKEILAFEVVSSTEWSYSVCAPFLPNVFVDISAYLDVKMRSLEFYHMEMRVFPHARCIDNVMALSRYRGCTVGFEAAEAFMSIRKLID